MSAPPAPSDRPTGALEPSPASPPGRSRLDPLLSRFFAARIQAWLERELGPGALTVSAAGASFTLRGDRGPRFQLRLDPKRCRWHLRARLGRSWQACPPSRPCLSLTDWLGQVRRRATLPTFDTPQGP